MVLEQEDFISWNPVFPIYQIKPGDGSKKNFIGNKNPRICKFCQRDDAETTFQKVAHIIPAAFGNRSLFSNEECDDCNQHFGSTLENELSNFLSLPRAISRYPARKGTPKIKSSTSQASYIQSQPSDNSVYVFQPTDDDGVRIHDNGNGSFKLSIDTPKYRPINVARAIGRIALFLLDNNYPNIENLRDWVCGKIDLFPIPLVVTNFPGTETKKIIRFTCCEEVTIENRHIIRGAFMYSSFLTVVLIPMDRKPIPESIRILDYPLSIQQQMLENTSCFSIEDDSIESGGVAEVFINYETCTAGGMFSRR